MATRDVMEVMNEQDDATLQRFIERFEFRGRHPRFVAFREAYLREMELSPSATVLEIGCGTGVVARALAARSGFSGRITAVDQSPVLLEATRRLAAQEGVGERLEFRAGDAHALDLPDASFDAVIAHTLLSHVTDPAAVLAEAARVVRPGGVVAIFDGDYASWTFGCSDPVLGKAMGEALPAAVVSKPRVMRDLPRLLRGAGLALAAGQAHAYAEIGVGRFFLGQAETFAPMVARAGLLPAARVEAWLADQRKASEEGVFFGACNYYAYIARRPETEETSARAWTRSRS
jgi:SAM-dependent methyltransferase